MKLKSLAACLSVAVCLWSAGIADAQQHRVDPRNMYERVVAVVALTGSGTYDDPIRPMHVPKKTSLDGIMAFSWQPTDDGKSAIVEFVARDRDALKSILEDTQLAGKVFERGKSKRADVERELKKHKRDLDLDKFAGGRK